MADGAGGGEKGTSGMGHRQILAVSDLEIVPAVFREWGPFQPDLRDLQTNRRVRQFNVTSYQRIHPRAVRYVLTMASRWAFTFIILYRYDNSAP